MRGAREVHRTACVETGPRVSSNRYWKGQPGVPAPHPHARAPVIRLREIRGATARKSGGSPFVADASPSPRRYQALGRELRPKRDEKGVDERSLLAPPTQRMCLSSRQHSSNQLSLAALPLRAVGRSAE